MKKVFTIFLFLTFCALTAFLEDFNPNSQHNQIYDYNNNGLRKIDQFSYSSGTIYKLNVDYISEKKTIKVSEQIVWKNITDFPTKELWFHLYANGYKSNNTIFSQRCLINSDTRTEINFSSVKINGSDADLIYVCEKDEYPNDSTVAKIILDKDIGDGDSAVIEFNYTMHIPKSMKRLGYASGREFIFVSQWYPKLGVFEKGEWVCSSFYPNTNFYSDFADYEVILNLPDEYTVASTGFAQVDSILKRINTYRITQNGVHDFVWLATNEIEEFEKKISRSDSSTFLLRLFLQPENEQYADRYFNVINNAVKFCEEYFGPYPYEILTCVDVPRTSRSGGMEYPTLFTVRTELFPRKATLNLEELAVHEFVHQYFQGIVANNEVHEAWLDEGITTYLTSKIVTRNYGTPYVTFRFLDYLAIEGINFLSYSEIPLIYTLGDYQHPEGYNSYYNYYLSNNIGSISDSSNTLPNIMSYYVNSYYKSELMLLSLERIIGEENLLSVIGNYYKKYRFKHPSANDFINEIKDASKENLDWFLNSCYKGDGIFDYAITGITNTKENEYEIIAERLQDGIFENDIALYTDVDTLYTYWDGKERWKKFTFKTENKVLGAEIDPLGKNRFDMNYANNSFTVDKRFWASFSFSLRWFFWIQNALLILGSIG